MRVLRAPCRSANVFLRSRKVFFDVKRRPYKSTTICYAEPCGCGQAPSVRQSRQLSGADYGAGFGAVAGTRALAQLRPAVCRYPFGRCFGFAFGALHPDVVAKSNDEAEPQAVEMLVACLVTETAISEQRDTDVNGREELVQTLDDFVPGIGLAAPSTHSSLRFSRPMESRDRDW